MKPADIASMFALDMHLGSALLLKLYLQLHPSLYEVKNNHDGTYTHVFNFSDNDVTTND